MTPVEISKNIFWVGVVDWNIRDFHGYSTYQGTTYNAYLILDEKITLIDTVKNEFAGEFLDKISGIVDPRKIDLLSYSSFQLIIFKATNAGIIMVSAQTE